MRPLKTLLVGIIAFGLGIVVASKFPLSAVGQQAKPQKPPVSITRGPDGIKFQNLTKNPVLVVGLANPRSTGFTIETGAAVVAPRDPSVFIIIEYLRVQKWLVGGNDQIGPCYPAECILPPPPPPPPYDMLQLNPRLN